MTTKEIGNFRRRIVRARNSFSVFGDMALHLDIDAMTQAKRIELRQALLTSRNPLIYAYLETKIAKEDFYLTYIAGQAS